MTRDLRWETAWPSHVIALVRATFIALFGLAAVAGVQQTALAAPSPSSSPGDPAQLGHTVTVFGVIFFGIAALAVVMFIIVVLRLRKS
jgi:hypothetical protein